MVPSMSGLLNIEPEPLAGAGPAMEPTPSLNVVGIHDDFASGKRVMRIYDRLRQQFDHEYAFRINFWRFDALDTRKLRKLAAAEAVAADVVFIATRARGPLPEQTKTWVRRWLLNHTN